MESWIARVDSRLDVIQSRLSELERLDDIQRRLMLLENIPSRVAVIEERCTFRASQSAAAVSGRWGLYVGVATGILGAIAVIVSALI
jgi:hypothetical protein